MDDGQKLQEKEEINLRSNFNNKQIFKTSFRLTLDRRRLCLVKI